jgi:O-antigen ligase
MFKEFLQNIKNIPANDFHSRFPGRIITLLLILTAISFAFSVAALQIFSMVLFLFWLTEQFSYKKKAFNIFCLLFALMLFIRLLSSFLSEYPGATWESFYKEFPLYFSLFAFTFYFTYLSTEAVFTIIKILLIFIAITSVIAIIQLIVKDLPRAIGIVTSLNTMLLIAYLTLLGLYNQLWIKGQQLFWTIILILITICLVLTLTKTHILIAFVFTFFLLFKNKIKWYYITALFTIVVFSVIHAFSDNPHLLKQRISDPLNLSSREYLWKGGTELLGKHPFLGFGPKTFKEIFQYQNEVADKDIGGWHNDFLEVYLESGIAALVILITVYFLVYWKGIKSLIRNKAPSLQRDLLFTSLLNISGLLLVGLTWGVLFPAVLQIFTAFNLAIFGSVVRKFTESKPDTVT